MELPSSFNIKIALRQILAIVAVATTTNCYFPILINSNLACSINFFISVYFLEGVLSYVFQVRKGLRYNEGNNSFTTIFYHWQPMVF